jgi:hypothetical protein
VLREEETQTLLEYRMPGAIFPLRKKEKTGG